MNRLEREMIEIKALRDTAKQLVLEDIENIKGDVSAKGVASRFSARMSEGASDVFDEAVSAADSHRGVLGTLIAAVLIWFAKTPILSLFDDLPDGDEGHLDDPDEFGGAPFGDQGTGFSESEFDETQASPVA